MRWYIYQQWDDIYINNEMIYFEKITIWEYLEFEAEHFIMWYGCASFNSKVHNADISLRKI